MAQRWRRVRQFEAQPSTCLRQPAVCSLSTKLCRADEGDERVASVLRRQPLERFWTSARAYTRSCMGQRLSSSSSTMATNVEKTEGEEKTFVCAVSTGS